MSDKADATSIMLQLRRIKTTRTLRFIYHRYILPVIEDATALSVHSVIPATHQAASAE
ncbi:Uncharacterised protein [Vibrio cholerae]|nr:Uncharacterised protein [Vibrio cholerae]